jgi:hypothetical protein
MSYAANLRDASADGVGLLADCTVIPEDDCLMRVRPLPMIGA